MATIKIISVFPKAFHHECGFGPVDGKHGYRSVFHMDPAPPGGYSEIEVPDNLGQMTYMGDGQGIEGTYHRGQRMVLEADPMAIPRHLIFTWAGNGMWMDATGHPGVAIRDESVPLEDQLASLRVIQTEYFNRCLEEGNRRSRIDRALIPEQAFEAAKFFGVQPAWASPERPRQKVDCVFCGFQMTKDVPVCPNCHNVVDQAKFAELKRAAQPVPPPAKLQTEQPALK